MELLPDLSGLPVGAKGGKQPQVHGVAGLYLVANVGGEPAVLLIAESGEAAKPAAMARIPPHVPNRGQMWNPPGGKADPKEDKSLFDTARREFREEVGLREKWIGRLKDKFPRKVAIDNVHSSNNREAWVVRVFDTEADKVEAHFGLANAGRSRKTRMGTRLSSEASGYVWVRVSDLRKAANNKRAMAYDEPVIDIGTGKAGAFKIQLRMRWVAELAKRREFS
jgi:8-oxo-dGTP pyrophosphatase MutT (NUDIX family)